MKWFQIVIKAITILFFLFVAFSEIPTGKSWLQKNIRCKREIKIKNQTWRSRILVKEKRADNHNIGILILEDQRLSLSLYWELYDYVDVGDSLIKEEGQFRCTIIKPDTTVYFHYCPRCKELSASVSPPAQGSCLPA
jgi:hypothetical protein